MANDNSRKFKQSQIIVYHLLVHNRTADWVYFRQTLEERVNLVHYYEKNITDIRRELMSRKISGYNCLKKITEATVVKNAVSR